MTAVTLPVRPVPAMPWRALFGLWLVLLTPLAVPWLPPAQPPGSGARSLADVAGMPLQFVPNIGQSDPAVRMEARGLGGTLFFGPDAVTLVLPSGAGDPAVARLRFDGANAAPEIKGVSRAPGVVNYHRGADPARWQTDAPAYAGMIYERLYPGIDLRYDGDGGTLKGTYFVAPGADPARIRWRYDGARGMRLDPATGNLEVDLGGAQLIEHAPVAWQMIDDRRVPVDVQFSRQGRSLGFALGHYDPAHALVIDPTLLYGSYLGGSGLDEARDIAVDGDGNIYVAGTTLSTDFPGANNALTNDADILVAKLNPQGTAVLWSTYLGGAREMLSDYDDQGVALAVSPAGEVVVAGSSGTTFSFPVTSDALMPTQAPRSNAVLAKLDGAGALVYGTYLGINLSIASNYHMVDKPLALDRDGNIYLTGQWEREPYGADGSRDVAVLGIKADGSDWLLRGYFGGDKGGEWGTSIAVGANDKLYLTGVTFATGLNDFPVTANAFQPACSGKLAPGSDGTSCGYDGFVTVINPDGVFDYSTFLGAAVDGANAIAVDGAGNMYVSGRIVTPFLPTVNAYQAACPSGRDPQYTGLCNSYEAFVMRLNADGGQAWSTYLGSSDAEAVEEVGGMAVSAGGTVYVTGVTNGPAFPTRHAVQPAFGGGQCEQRPCNDAFVSVLTPEGRLWSSTFLGGSGDDYAYGITLDGAGNPYVIGATHSADFQTTTGAVQTGRSGAADMFIAKLDVVSAPPPPTTEPTTPAPTTAVPTTAVPTTAVPTTAVPTTAVPTTPVPEPGQATRVFLPLIWREGGGPPPTTSPTTPTTSPTTPTTPPADARGALYPNGNVKAASAASAVDAAGGMHAAYRHFIPDSERPPAVYAYCAPPAERCGDAANWQTVKLADLAQEVQLALTPAGQPRLLIVATSTVHAGGKDFWYAACDANCADQSRWSVTRVLSSYGTAVFDGNDEYTPQRSFALDKLGRPRFVYMDRNYIVEPDHLSAFYAYCDANCADPANWQQTQIGREYRATNRYEVWSYPSLAFTSANQPRVIAEVSPINPDGSAGTTGLYYYTCDAGCEQPAGWQRGLIGDVGTGSWPPRSWDIELDANDRPRIAIFYGDWLGDTSEEHRLFYLWCDDACLNTASWQRTSPGLSRSDGQGPDLELDKQGRPRIAYATGLGNIGYAWCDTACESQAQWRTQVVETYAQMQAGNPQAIPPHCDGSTWKGLNPVLALDGAGNPRIAYDVSADARCYYDDTPENPDDQPRIEFGRIWNGVRWNFFPRP